MAETALADTYDQATLVFNYYQDDDDNGNGAMPLKIYRLRTASPSPLYKE